MQPEWRTSRSQRTPPAQILLSQNRWAAGSTSLHGVGSSVAITVPPALLAPKQTPVTQCQYRDLGPQIGEPEARKSIKQAVHDLLEGNGSIGSSTGAKVFHAMLFVLIFASVVSFCLEVLPKRFILHDLQSITELPRPVGIRCLVRG